MKNLRKEIRPAALVQTFRPIQIQPHFKSGGNSDLSSLQIKPLVSPTPVSRAAIYAVSTVFREMPPTEQSAWMAFWDADSSQAEKEAREDLLLRYRSIAESMVRFHRKKYLHAIRRGMPILSAALVGLDKAICTFNPFLSTFPKFAKSTIRFEFLTEERKTSPHRRSLTDEVRKYRQLAETFHQRGILHPSLQELANAMNVSLAKMQQIVAAAQGDISLESIGGDNEESSRYEIADPAADSDPTRRLIMRDEIQHAITHLSPREREILCLRWKQNMNQAEISEVFQVCPARIAQILAGIYRKLRKYIDPNDPI